ncbi:MAG: hypothetical protein U0165_07660 [Polyangiaceae bacterium]
MASLSALSTLPAPITHASRVIASLDECLMLGFGRLGAPQLKSLEALASTFVGTPLGAPVQQASSAIRRSELTEKPFVALAAARAALQGAQHDALAAQLASACGFAPLTEPSLEGVAQETPSHHQVWLESTRQWLTELAIAGFLQLGPEALMPFHATLEKIQEEPALARQGALITGFWNELVAAVPIPQGTHAPSYRWGDLWARTMLLSVRAPDRAVVTEASGEFRPLGAELFEHAHVATLVVYGVLRDGTSSRWARATVSSYKVDVVQGPEIGALLSAKASTLLEALAGSLSIKLNKMPLSSTGDLLWDDKRASSAAAFAPLDEAQQAFGDKASSPAAVSAPLAAERHPVLLARPVFLDAASVAQKGDNLVVEQAGASISVASARLGTVSVDRDRLSAAKQVFGLLRFDSGSWSIQPLVLAAGKGAHVSGAEWAKRALATKGQGPTLTILRERAGRLLRAKS